MKPVKITGGQKLLTFILIAVFLILMVGFAVNGLQEPNNTEDGKDILESENSSDGADKDAEEENTDNTEQNTDKTPPIENTKFYNSITGLEIAESDLNKIPLGFVTHSSMPLYGISGSDLTIEFPTENGTTRLLTYTSNDAILWKVGSLAPTRSFINCMSNFFGGTIVAFGKDDIIQYSAIDNAMSALDISKEGDCYYVENTHFVYTSKEMVSELIKRNNLLASPGYKSAPFEFVAEGESVIGLSKAKSITLPYTNTEKTEFQYSESTNQYLYFKNGQRKIDMLNGKNISFTNLFILFANTTTYEKAEGVEMVVDTTAGGNGYYVSGGTKTEIRWSTTLEGELEFCTLDGEILKINRGTSYIGYYKASQISKVSFS